nr:MAG TPA: hypothetical protein [Caudoviricetes sp.]
MNDIDINLSLNQPITINTENGYVTVGEFYSTINTDMKLMMFQLRIDNKDLAIQHKDEINNLYTSFYNALMNKAIENGWSIFANNE